MSTPSVAVVTGAARGIGFALAQQPSERGHRVLLPDLDETAVKAAAERIGMVGSREKDPGAAMLFSGPRPLAPEKVAATGLDLLERRQIFRVLPRWRGVLVRAVDASPVMGLTSLALMRRLGDRRQRRL